MSASNGGPENDKQEQLIAAARRNRELREQDYREMALKRFPHMCARCGREFEGRKLRELTVHHKDHNHDNNPPDGSNWELLCLYCHDNEHQEYLDQETFGAATPAKENRPAPLQKPFAALEELMKGRKN
jgi:5-methylcytosine-specific restriction endonuclease McrA